MRRGYFLPGVLAGIFIGMVLSNLMTSLGEQRYSNAIKQCVRDSGPNRSRGEK